MQKYIFISFLLFLSLQSSDGVKCYQCSTGEDPKGKDLCGAYERFRTEEHVPVDCLQEESVTPGTFCVKIVKQGPIGYIWDGRWRNVIRRCASVTETGVTNVCNWGVDPSGIYYEECYCTSDGCNTAMASARPVVAMVTMPLLAVAAFLKLA